MSNTDTIPEPALKLQLPMPHRVVDRLEAIANSHTPRTSRNALIEWVLTEFAAGNFVHVDQIKGKAAA